MAMLKDSARTTESSNALGKTNDVHTNENLVVIEYMEVGCDEDCLEKLQKTDLVSSQELSARTINPMKLIMLLRVRFGIGRYEISVRLPPGKSNRRHKLTVSTRRGCATYIIFGHQDAFP
jgi:hypothetical protein